MTLLLIIIYLAFISLGLPDSLLGSAWPSMYESFGVSVSSAGLISMTVSAGTIISSLFSNRLIHKLGTGWVTLLSVAMTAVALLGFSLSGQFWMLCLCAVPLGLGAGSVDAALNNFVALHYKAVHMNWLHGFWGLGTIIGPLIIYSVLSHLGTWRSAYRLVSMLQFALVAVLFLSRPLWKRAVAQVESKDVAEAESTKEKKAAPISLFAATKLPKAKATMMTFFCYSIVEQTMMLWGGSYLVIVRSLSKEVAAGWISLFFVGITLGRFLSGVLSLKLSSRRLIVLGEVLIGAGVLLLILPLPIGPMLAGIFLAGLGCAPIFPGLLHETPNTFGKQNSQALMGMQMAAAYLGTTFMPPLFGLIGGKLGYNFFPIYLGLALAVMTSMTVRIFTRTSRR